MVVEQSFTREKKYTKDDPNSYEFYFALHRDDDGYYFSLEDKKGGVLFPRPFEYPSPIKEALQSFYSELLCFEELTDFKLYLDPFSDAVQQIVQCFNILSLNGLPVDPRIKNGRFAYLITIGKPLCKLRLMAAIEDEGEFCEPVFISRDLAIAGESIVQLPTSRNNVSAASFQCRRSEIEKILSMIASGFPEISLELEGYEIVSMGAIPTRPAILMDKLDGGKWYSLQLGFTMSDGETDFLNAFGISSLVRLKKMKCLVFELSHDYEQLPEFGMRMEKFKSFFDSDLMQYQIEAPIFEKFINEELDWLTTRFQIFGSKRFLSKSDEAVLGPLVAERGSGIDFFKGLSSPEIAQESYNPRNALEDQETAGYRKLILRNGAKFFPGGESQEQKVHSPSSSIIDSPEVVERLKTKKNEDLISKAIFHKLNTLKEAGFPDVYFADELYEYQKYGVNWLRVVTGLNYGACLADEMGLGKTIQVIVFLSLLYKAEKLNSLIVVPASVLHTWINEFKRAAPHLKVSIYHGKGRDLPANNSERIILTSYEILRREIEEFMTLQFACVVLDESQRIKNFRTKTSKAAALLQAEYRIALSGTPIENRLEEIFALFRFLNPSLFGGIDDFRREYINPILDGNEERIVQKLRLVISPFILRRTKSQVITDLPKKNEYVREVNMNQPQSRFYEIRRQYYKRKYFRVLKKYGPTAAQFVLLAGFTELRIIATVPEVKTKGEIEGEKIPIILSLIENALKNNEKVLVFSNFLGTIDLLEKQLSETDVTTGKITGKTEDKNSVVEKFQKNPEISVLLMTLKAGGVGLNLTAASQVILCDPWWNSAAEDQALDRVHRIGQGRKVNCVKLISKNTIEERIRLLQQQKIQLIDSVLSGELQGTKNFSDQEIELLLS
jgi:superfamily II DNA or RNA helicase